jgi:hypothetical protein
VTSNKIVNEPLISAIHCRTPTLRYPVSGIRYLLLFLLPFAFCHAAPAAPQDLGRNLTYVRLRHLPDDAAVLTAVWSAPALIVDLRYPAGDGAHALPAGLPARTGAAPLFVLVGPGTPVELLAALRERAPGLITLGLPAPGLAPDIAPAVTPEADRRAYDALDAGTPVDALTNVTITKQRFDEAALTREHDHPEDGTVAPPDVPAPPAGPPAPPAAAAAPAKPPEPPPLVDVVLQRAVQLHRALLALGKL